LMSKRTKTHYIASCSFSPSMPKNVPRAIELKTTYPVGPY
jgi:hypothetical protein